MILRAIGGSTRLVHNTAEKGNATRRHSPCILRGVRAASRQIAAVTCPLKRRWIFSATEATTVCERKENTITCRYSSDLGYFVLLLCQSSFVGESGVDAKISTSF